MGAIAETLADAVRQNGGDVRYRQEVTRIVVERGRPVAVETKRGDSFPADLVIANLPPWNIARLLGDDMPARLRRLPDQPGDGWGAFMVYAGVDSSVIAEGGALHRQVVVREPLGEGNSVFVSISPAGDSRRAPGGRRAVTISTHTELPPWWQLFEQDRPAYEARKQRYLNTILMVAEQALPGLRATADLVLPGTPVTFQRFTRRANGWVGGFPQTSLLRGWGPRLGPGLWMVGDSVFPGQSTAAVALGGLRVAGAILAEAGVDVSLVSKSSQPVLPSVQTNVLA
ncbi:MAG: FAD-dependent oxidoreductase, partial [Anaerolineae bacterium]|nr:FAD-dependent oxidoreductase [Anaerolineae bacterium]